MAKKGSSNDVIGFTNMKTTVATKTKPKVTSGDLAETQSNKTTAAKKNRKEEVNVSSKLKQTLNKDPLEKKSTLLDNAKNLNKPNSNVDKKGKSQVSQDKLKTRTLSTNEIKEDQINKIRKSQNTQKMPVATEQDNQKKFSPRDIKSKQTPMSSSQKKQLIKSNADKTHKIFQKDDSIKKRSTETIIKEKGTKSESRKVEVSKNHIQARRLVETNNISDSKTTSNSKIDNNISSKTNYGSLLKTKSSKIVNTALKNKNLELLQNPKELKKPDKKIDRSSESAVAKTTLPQEVLSNTSNYKDLLYFEVDVGNSKRPSTSRNKSARKKSLVSHPPPISRQGTFTKEDGPMSPEPTNHTSEEINREEQRMSNSTDDDVEYEDDFEDYESDFEEYVSESGSESGLSSKSETNSETSELQLSKKPVISNVPIKCDVKEVEEEKKLDSGNYDLSLKPVLPQSLRQKHLDQIKEAISQENISLFNKREEDKVASMEAAIKGEYENTTLDFVKAFNQKEHSEKLKKEEQRSSAIMKMIKLYEKEIDLFEETFTDDKTFENLYDRRNVSHAYTETDFTMKEEETQTNEIITCNMWTQYPIRYQQWSSKSFSYKVFLEDQRGYGGDSVTVDCNTWLNAKYDKRRLSRFINSASKVILVLLEEEAIRRAEYSSLKAKSEEEFSDEYIPISSESVTFLKERPICDILFSPHDSNVFVTSHRFIQDIEKLSSFIDQFYGRSILCVWNKLEPSHPLHLLVASCQICVISFDLDYDYLLYAGLTDGSICLWDLSESSLHHKRTVSGSMEYLLRAPTYCTSHLSDKDYHQNVIVSIKSLGCQLITTEQFQPSQILTLDTDGVVVLWLSTKILSSLEKSEKNISEFDFGISYWGKYKLMHGGIINLENLFPSSQDKWGLQFFCMNLAPEPSNKKLTDRSVLVGTNVGSILHFYATEDDIDVPVFSSETEDNFGFSVMCIERNPHGYMSFLAGCSDGKVRFYKLHKPKPFRILSCDKDFVYAPIINIKWSPIGIGLFFVLDKNFDLHFWDLCKGEIFPQLSSSLKSLRAVHFDVTCDEKFVYLIMAVHKTKIHIYRLKQQLANQNSEQEKNIFQRFMMKTV